MKKETIRTAKEVAFGSCGAPRSARLRVLGGGLGGMVSRSQEGVTGRYELLSHLSPKGWWDYFHTARSS